jgi:hypothetical protein
VDLVIAGNQVANAAPGRRRGDGAEHYGTVRDFARREDSSMRSSLSSQGGAPMRVAGMLVAPTIPATLMASRA